MNYVSATCGQHINKLLSEPVKLSPFRVISLLVCGALYIVAQAGCIVFGLIYLVGRAVTSPHKSVQIAWHYGQSLCGANATGYLLSGFLSMLSIATTMLVYGLIFPIALKYLAVIVLPHLPVPLLAATHFVSSHVLPVFSIAGKAILMPVLGPVFRLFGVGVSPAIVSLSVISGLVVSTIGTVIKRTLERFKTWRHQCTKKTMEESVPARTEVSIDCYQRPALDRDERPAELDSQKKWASFQSQSTSKLTPGFFFARTPDRQSETPLPPQCSM